MLKIIKVKKIYDDTSKDKYGNISKSFWCDVEFNGKPNEGFVKINIKHIDDVKDNAEFNEVSYFETKTGKSSYFIKQPKKDWKGNGGGGRQQVSYTLDEASTLLTWCKDQKVNRENIELFKVMTVMGIKIQTTMTEIKAPDKPKENKEETADEFFADVDEITFPDEEK